MFHLPKIVPFVIIHEPEKNESKYHGWEHYHTIFPPCLNFHEVWEMRNHKSERNAKHTTRRVLPI